MQPIRASFPTSSRRHCIVPRIAVPRVAGLGLLLACAAVVAGSAGAMAQSPAPGAKGSQPASALSCAALGPDFMKMPGSDSCVRMRAAVRADGFAGGAMSNVQATGNGPTDLSAASGVTQTDPWKQAR